MNLSATQLSLYKKCPAAYKFRYILGLEVKQNETLEEAMRFGTEFHENIIDCNSKDNMIIAMHEAINKHHAFKEYREKITAKEDSHVIDYGWFNMRAIYDANTDDAILEFKSASKPWPKEKFESELQPTIYQLSEYLRTGKIKKFVYFVVTKSLRPTIQHWERKELPENDVKELLNIAKLLRNDFQFKPTGHKKNECFFCDYKEHCEAYF